MKDLKDTLRCLLHVIAIAASMFALLGAITMMGHGDEQYQQRYLIEEEWR